MTILISKECTASFDVDAQNTFTPLCPMELPVPEGHLIVDELNKNADFAKIRIGSKDAHSLSAMWIANEKNPQFSPVNKSEHDDVDIHWKPHAIVGTEGFELIEGLPRPSDYDFFVWKGIELNMHPYGACYHDLGDTMSTGVIEYMKAQSIDTVIVGGLALDYCVHKTVMQLINANFRVIINQSSVKGIAPDTSENAVNEMRSAGAIFIENTQSIEMV